MSSERTVPGPLALSAFAPKLDPDWHIWMDQNLLKASVFLHLSVISKDTALPGSPTDKDIYIVPSGAGSNPNEIAVYDVDTWVYYTPVAGMRAYVDDEDLFYYWDGAAWAQEGGAGALSILDLSDTPGSFGTEGQVLAVNAGGDGLEFVTPSGGGSSGYTIATKTGNYTAVLGDANTTYIRMNVAGANTFTIPPNSSVAFPIGTTLQGSQAGAGVTTITPGSGVTINSLDGLTDTAGQYAGWMATKVATDTWELTGALA